MLLLDGRRGLAEVFLPGAGARVVRTFAMACPSPAIAPLLAALAITGAGAYALEVRPAPAQTVSSRANVVACTLLAVAGRPSAVTRLPWAVAWIIHAIASLSGTVTTTIPTITGTAGTVTSTACPIAGTAIFTSPYRRQRRR